MYEKVWMKTGFHSWLQNDRTRGFSVGQMVKVVSAGLYTEKPLVPSSLDETTSALLMYMCSLSLLSGSQSLLSTERLTLLLLQNASQTLLLG